MKRSLLLPVMLLAACALDTGPVGEATATITQVPAGVACIQIQVVGSRTVTASSDVMAGVSSVITLGNLPPGSDTFTAVAFAGPCSSIAGATANWASLPVVATVAAGATVPVTLAMQPVGGASVGVDFPDGGSSPNDLSTGPIADLSAPSDLACVPQTPVCPSNFCGWVKDNCGNSSPCSTCTGGGVCVSFSGTCCQPNKAAACMGRVCGNAVNNCGQYISCGTCKGGSTCDQASGTCTPPACDCSKIHCKVGWICDSADCSCGPIM